MPKKKKSTSSRTANIQAMVDSLSATQIMHALARLNPEKYRKALPHPRSRPAEPKKPANLQHNDLPITHDARQPGGNNIVVMKLTIEKTLELLAKQNPSDLVEGRLPVRLMGDWPLEKLAELLDSLTEAVRLVAAHEIRRRAAKFRLTSPIGIWDAPDSEVLAAQKQLDALENKALDVIVTIGCPDDPREQHQMRIDLIRQAKDHAWVEQWDSGDTKTDA